MEIINILKWKQNSLKIDYLEMLFSLKMEQYILVNGQMIKNLVKEYKFGKMVQFMRDIGYVIKLKVKVDYIMQMEIFMMEYILNIYF